MTDDLSPDLRHHLLSLGMSDKKIAQCNRDTRLWQDLRIYGEIADDFLADLLKEYQIDMSEFNPEKYYPNEVEGKNIFMVNLIFFIPFLNDYLRSRRVFAPLTLGMIDDAINSKRLV
jgi:hypothetical protein